MEYGLIFILSCVVAWLWYRSAMIQQQVDALAEIASSLEDIAKYQGRTIDIAGKRIDIVRSAVGLDGGHVK